MLADRPIPIDRPRGPAVITYRTGDATQPVGEGPIILAHITNNVGAWGKGFAGALSKRWREPEIRHRSGRAVLGTVQMVRVQPFLWVANMCAQNGLPSRENPKPVDYVALGTCLDAVAHQAIIMGASVHCPRIGTGHGGGRWEEIRALLIQRLVACGVPVTVYDL